MVQAQVAVPLLERVTEPYRYKDLCFGGTRTIVEALQKSSNNFFSFVRVEPIKEVSERVIGQVFQDLLPWICRENGLKPEISRLIDLHLLTLWTWPVRIMLTARTKTGIEADLAKFLEILQTCLNEDQIEEFRASTDANHQESYNSVAESLNQAAKAGLRLEASLVEVYTREELEKMLAFFISPHPSSCGHYGPGDDY